MKRRIGKKLVSAIQAIILCVQLLPMAALASLLDNSPAYNQEILAMLESMVGEDDALAYYYMLQQYGLLDEDGSEIESWDIWMDGEQVTLEELRALLEGDYDPDHYILVDNTPITLGDLATIIEIEDYLAYLQETYFSGAQWSEEQLASLDSLMAQINSEGIMMLDSSGGVTWPSNIDHSARVDFKVTNTTPQTVGTQTTFTINCTATLTGGVPGQEVTFQVAPLSAATGNHCRMGRPEQTEGLSIKDGSTYWGEPLVGVTLTPENPKCSFSIKMTEYGEDPPEDTIAYTGEYLNTPGDGKNGHFYTLEGINGVKSSATQLFLFQLYDIENALFSNGREYMLVQHRINQTLMTGTEMAAIKTVAENGIIWKANMTTSGTSDYTLNDAEFRAIMWDILDFYGWRSIVDGDKIRKWYIDGGGREKEEPANPQFPSDFAYDIYVAGYNKNGNIYDEHKIGMTFRTGNAGFAVNQMKYYNRPFYSYGEDKYTIGYYVGSDGEYNAPVIWGTRKLKFCATYLYLEESGEPKRDSQSQLLILSTGTPKVMDVYIPCDSETYYPGDTVPIFVRWNQPVKVTNGKLKINGTTLTSAYGSADKDNSYSINQVYLYTLPEVTTSSWDDIIKLQSVSGTGLNGNVGTETNLDSYSFNIELNERDTITGVTAAVQNAITEPVLHATVSLHSAERMTTWLNTATDEDGAIIIDNLAASIDGGETLYYLTPTSDKLTGGTLTADIPLELNTSDTAEDYVVELFRITDDTPELMFGKYATASLSPAVFITDGDLTVNALSVQNADGNGDYALQPDADGNNTLIYPQDSPVIKASFTLASGSYSFGDTSKTTIYLTGEDGKKTLADETAHFVWQSSDPTIANIAADGTITPTGKAGKVSFTLTALNGGVAGKAVSIQTEALNFGAGLTPFLLIPNKEITSVASQPVTLFWSSNVSDKNGASETKFEVEVYRGTAEFGADGAVHTVTKTGNAETPAASVTIPAEVLKYDYETNVNTFTVWVSTTYNGVTCKDKATITLESRPAEVKLEKLDSYYITDKGTVNIGWEIDNFDQYSSDKAENLFKLLITRDGEEVHQTSAPGTGADGVYTGSYKLNIADVQADTSDPTSYRKVYTVTIQAKNGTDSTWSYDSFLLYVYDEEALEIWVNGAKDADNAITLSNVAEISKMSQEQILALNRDIYLKSIVSVNYGDYAWSEIADQMKWASSNSGIASVNYQQGTLYENIEHFSYVSYRPTTQFGLAGLDTGTAEITATHKLAGMSETLEVTVESLRDKLYLFQCYPQATTTLTYTNGKGETKEVKTDETGAAAIYEESGIASDVYCTSTVKDKNGKDIAYLGTFFQSALSSGEGDWTQLERYPCNSLTLRRAAYAYLYVKDENGAPYTGSVTFRGGVYVNDQYLSKAQFVFEDGQNVTLSGDKDQTVKLGSDGKLTVIMDQTQWEGELNRSLTTKDAVSYKFYLNVNTGSSTKYYPMMLALDAAMNQDDYVGSGEAIVNLRLNDSVGKHPFIALQASSYTNYITPSNLLDYTGKAGPTDSLPEAVITTAVMWWGVDESALTNPKLQLVTETGVAVAAKAGEYSIVQTAYPFVDESITQYTVKLNASTLGGILGSGESIGAYLDYYADGVSLSRHESLPFQLCSMLGMGKVENAQDISTQLKNKGKFVATDGSTAAEMDSGDEFVDLALWLVSSGNYSTGDDKLFRIQITPTADPTKFLGFIEVNIGNMNDKDQVTGVYAQTDTSGKGDLDKTPGLNELMTMAGSRSVYSYLMDDYNRVLKRQGVRNLSMQLGGYAESLIYYNKNSGRWEIQVLNGGFNMGGGVSYTWNWNFMVGPVPLTTSMTIGGTTEISMDALSVAYYNGTTDTSGIGTDYLTELRIYLYLRFFAGVGIDYAVVAFKLGIYGQINVDMQFQWLNRPYMDVKDKIMNVADQTFNDSYLDYKSEANEALGIPAIEIWKSPNSTLSGQHFRIDGQIGLEFVVRILFINYEKVLYSYNFNALNKSTNDWEKIQTNWSANQAAQQAVISELLGSKSLSVSSVGGQQMMSLNLAPTLEDVSYLEEGSFWNDGSFSLMSLDAESALSALNYNSYAYANPVVSDDGELVAYLDTESTSVEDIHAYYAVKNSSGSYSQGGVIDDKEGYGDSQVSLSGTQEFAVAAWTRQMGSVSKDEGESVVLTEDDQMIILNGTEIYAGVYTGSDWATTRLTDNTTADLAPVVATNGQTGKDARAIVAWRAVAASGEKNSDGYAAVTTFDEKDTILYKVYDASNSENGGWSDTETLYNGTSGAVKALVAAMMDDGTAAVAYTLDIDGKDTVVENGETVSSINDREIYYAVISSEDGEVTRNVRATNDAYLDENPQLAVVTFPSAEPENAQRFVLGWYTEQAVDSDDAVTLDAGEKATQNQTTSDIRLMDIDSGGIYTQLLPDSISKAAVDYDVVITPTFRFTKNSGSINDLSILWVERAEGTVEEVENGENGGSYSSNTNTVVSPERDVLKGVKFYTYGQNSEIISFTGAIDVAEMGEGTLIDHFDAYVSDAENNQIKAVILGTTYNADDFVTKTGTTVGDMTVQYTVPRRMTSMYTATETYQDKIEVSTVLADYDTVKLGAKTQIMFSVKNNGIHAIKELKFTLEDSENGKYETTYGEDGELNLLPGATIQLYADYTVPADEVVDPTYTVEATFDESIGASGSADTVETATYRGLILPLNDLTKVPGTVYLDLPDVEITDAKIVKEEDGQRTIQIKLNNDSDTTLAKSGRQVKVSFYTDSTYETPFETGYGLDEFVIDQEADLNMLNEGSYSKQVTFNVGEYLKKVLTTTDNPVTEIPDGGITVYIKAEVLEPDTTSSKTRSAELVTLPEPISSNNYAAVTCENLKTRTGRNVSVTSSFDVENGNTVVTAYLQNNRLSQTTSGNVIVTLLDADGEVIGQPQQSYTSSSDSGNGLITLNGEEKKTVTFTFEGITNAAKAQVVYSDLIIGADNANLASLSFSNIPGITLSDFKADESDIYRAAVSTDDLTSTAVIVVPESNLATTLAYSGDNSGETGSSGAISKTVDLSPGKINTITVTVVNGDETRTYILTVQNNGDPVVTWPDETDARNVTYGTSVYYAADQSATINLTASATPKEDKENPAYQISYQWYSCDVNGGNRIALEDQTASTLTVPSTTNAGVYYYRCEIIRHLVNNSTTSYWSSVATVQINRATDNSVTLGGIEVTFDNQPHGLASATAAKEGSTLHYSTDGGGTWSETAPTFTSVGVHTVRVYATNPNYEDTKEITADVVIKEKEGTQFKLEPQPVADLYDSYPGEIKAQYKDADSLSSALTAAMKKTGGSEKNISAYGAKLMFSLDDGKSWTEATAENFPAAGMTVTIPYPEGTNRSRYNFILKQLVTDPLNTDKTVGNIDAVDITLTEDGIRFTADCLSALVLGWQLRPTSDPKYTVAVEDSEHGTFTVTPTQAAYNSTVTITAKPDDGYKVGKVTVTTQNGRELTVTNKGSNLYTFKMPFGSVNVKVSFVKSTEAVVNPFTDVSSSAYYYDAVLWAVENGVTSGTTTTTFSPNLACTRAQAVTFLWRAAGSPAPKSVNNPFTDVSSSAYYYDAVLWAVENGITAGTTATTFSPDQTCTRAQIVTFLWRAAGTDVTGSNPFSDVPTGAYYYDAVLWAVENEVTAGTSATTFSPSANCTRAQIVTFLYRAKV